MLIQSLQLSDFLLGIHWELLVDPNGIYVNVRVE
jgi:hypothetical protein